MRSMLRLRLQKIGSLLGLLAILMSTVAPTISQVRASQDRVSQALAVYCSADPANSAVTPDGKPTPSPAFHWQACPYCGLLIHLPVLPGTTAIFAAALLIVRAPVIAAHDATHIPLVYTAAQPRAPPAIS